jgi:hypothetical protein
MGQSCGLITAKLLFFFLLLECCSMLLPHRSRLDVPRYKWLTLQAVCLLEAVANLLFLGFYTVRWRGGLLFSDWLSPDE